MALFLEEDVFFLSWLEREEGREGERALGWVCKLSRGSGIIFLQYVVHGQEENEYREASFRSLLDEHLSSMTKHFLGRRTGVGRAASR